MIPIRLELHNFLAYRSPDALRLDGIHLACLTGPNGAGKSTILDAITWALWGRARAKRDDDMIHLGQNDMSVQLDFEQEGQLYRVIRRRSRKQRGTSTLDIFAWDDEQFHVVSEPSIRATQEKIDRLLRLDYDTFIHSAFLQQGKADAFTTKAPAQRKQILSDILGLAQWEAYEETVKERLKALENELNVIAMRLDEIEGELAKEPQLRQALAEAEQAQQDAQQALIAAEQRLEEVAHAPGAMRNAQERLAERQQRIKQHEHDLDSVAGDIERQMQRIQGYEAIIARRAEIEAGYAALQTAREADHSLGDKLRQLSDVETQRHDLARQLDAARSELEKEASACEASIVQLQRTLDNADADKLGQVEAEVLALQALEQDRSVFQDEAAALGEKKAELESYRRTLTIEGQNLRDRLARLEVMEEAVCPLCGQPLDDQHRQQLIEQLQEEIEQRRGDYATNQEQIVEVSNQVTEYRQRVNELDLELKRLGPLLAQAGVLQERVNAADAAATRLSEAQARLEAVRAVLEDEAYGQEIRAQLAMLDLHRSEIGYDSASHDAARQQLDTYHDYDARQKELDIALTALPDVQAALEAAHLRQERIQKALLEDQEAVEQLGAEIAQLTVLVQEQQVRQQEVNHLRTAERVAHERLTIAQQELEVLENQRMRKAELELRGEQKRHEEAMYKELREAFGKKGVPAMIIEAAIPELEAGANRLLARMTDGRMNLFLTTQREKVTGGMAETLEIQIADELGTRSYELYSGGEAFRINFALRVALSQMLARRAGAHLRTLFLDEGFGTQDEDGRNKLVEAITAIQDDFDLILVITHIDELRDSFPVHVVVEKTGSGSRVSVR
jgi:exonuclease SbcC